MNSWSLLASTAINLGLAFLILSLFSIAKKQPSNAPIYFAHPLSRRRHIPSYHHSFSRFLPSFSWIPQAFSVCEDDIIATSGLDALIIIRLFKFGINFFVACSLVGLLILLPVNYLNGPCSTSLRTDCFTISNINKGSNRTTVRYWRKGFNNFTIIEISRTSLPFWFKRFHCVVSTRLEPALLIIFSPDIIHTPIIHIRYYMKESTSRTSW